MPAFLLAIMLAAAAQSAPVPAPAAMNNVVFARGALAGWSMKATNVIDNGPSGPVINRMLCEMERNGLRVMTWRHDDIGFTFGGPDGHVVSGGRRHRAGHGDVRALEIDGVSYEAERRNQGVLTDRFTDVLYPESQHVYPPNGFYALALRRQGSTLWLDSSDLNNELIEARRLRVGFRENARGALLWIDVPLAGLAEGLGWCRAAMASPNALRLHPQ